MSLDFKIQETFTEYSKDTAELEYPVYLELVAIVQSSDTEILKNLKEYYGPDADFKLSSFDLQKLMKDIDKLRAEKISKDLLMFLEKLRDLARRAFEGKKVLVGLAD